MARGKSIKQVYIVIVGSNIGGTEKRFLELWDFFQKQGLKNIELVISKELLEKFSNVLYLKHLSENRENVTILSGSRFRVASTELFSFAKNTAKDAIFHYPGVSIPLLHQITGHSFILSNTISSFFEGEYSSLKTKILFFGSALTASRIDVLNPIQFEKFRKRFPFFSHKISLTPQNFVNHSIYSPEHPKKNDIVFLGRLSENDTKNVIPFVEAIPFIANFLSKNGISDFCFYILGHGALEKKLKNILDQNEYKNLPIIFRYEPNPNMVLAKSKVILSLQKHSNYPSRSLLEAMACGNVPIVTDVGETRLIAKEEFSEFISPELTPIEISMSLLRVLSMNDSDFYKKSSAVRKFVVENYSIQFQADYYLSLYGIEEIKSSFTKDTTSFIDNSY